MDFDVLFTIVFWATGLCLLFWVGLLLAGLLGEVMEDESPRDDSSETLGKHNVPV